ncbi:sulfatase-like hydrolase/transferase [Flavobacteriaceae bacterium R38]|nr:sulfatase-like hydrolase/transferase [Flavobacteriaceae bacterium R38]
MKKYIITLFCLGIFSVGTSQEKDVLSVKGVNQHVIKINSNLSVEPSRNPKLVVGIIVDQMRYDYLTRFWDRYGEGGFKRLINEGFNCKNNHYNYIPTFTGPGHASVFTGATPSSHGIISNYWYDKANDKSIYCVADDNYNSVGTSSDAGKMSPINMKTTTITDELRLKTQMKGKVIGIALKDRGAILPAGHAASAAYWFHGMDEGSWISSTFYMNELPKWVQDFNASDAAEKYKKDWNTIEDINTYVESGSDNNAFEGLFTGEKAPTFPHKLPKLWKKNKEFDIIKSTPYGNSLTADFALAAIDGESLGTDEITDFLTLSFSSTDYVGHKYGVNSKEIQDTYLRLDKDLERFFNALDEKVGKGEYTLFLTSDHGAVEVPSYLQSVRIPAGYFDEEAFEGQLKSFLKEKYKREGLIKNISNGQVFLDHNILKTQKISKIEIQQVIADEIINYKDIERVYTGHAMRTVNYDQGIPYLLQNGYHQKRSGDVLFVLAPSTIAYSKTGSTHGSGFLYDTHVPLLFYGNGISKGSTAEKTTVDDIAPTIATLLGISFPNGATGEPVYQAIED